ncbi:MAG TPA: hypothetical protein DCP92_21900 [Nitrospiraceae bacterium]|jgi:hypothetical protein|nr:hypothetical protein [Nitrospiraceae bacterium]
MKAFTVTDPAQANTNKLSYAVCKIVVFIRLFNAYNLSFLGERSITLEIFPVLFSKVPNGLEHHLLCAEFVSAA